MATLDLDWEGNYIVFTDKCLDLPGSKHFGSKLVSVKMTCVEISFIGMILTSAGIRRY